MLFFTIENSKNIEWTNIILCGVILMSTSLIESTLKFFTKTSNFDIKAVLTPGMFPYIAIIFSLMIFYFSYYIAMKKYTLKDI